MENICYYVLKNVHIKNNTSKKCQYRIATYNTKLPLLSVNSMEFEGPFVNLYALKKYSRLINELKKSDIKQYIKVLKDENFINTEDVIFISKNKHFPIDFKDMVEHGIKGNIKNGTVSGGHFLSENSIRVIEETYIDTNGVIEGFVEIYDHRFNKWIKKERKSTLFPKFWNLQKYFDECVYAMENKSPITENKFTSKTTCGIDTIIIVKKNKLISFYPVLKLKDIN